MTNQARGEMRVVGEADVDMGLSYSKMKKKW